MTLVILAFVVWAAAWAFNVWLVRSSKNARFVVPLIFGATLLIVWELLVRGLDVPVVILPPPSMVAATFAANLGILWADFVQTILKGAVSGYIVGAIAAFGVAILVDRFDFLRRGLLPVGNFMAALPIVGIAPIMVMWFGFDWQSKAAVVVRFRGSVVAIRLPLAS